MGRRKKVTVYPHDATLWNPPGTKRDPRADCAVCRGDGWTLEADGTPTEPARRCPCTDAETVL